ncbi:lipopolysaccharide biosynthesis protein [Pedobacter sandarakinus]|uniref:lipopolysaccharide biosynthesis protein n=1 Tax=Pedobacter sandarakinus TaxID=353156 RepID=UPI0022460B0B|nr:lipopolysaccharide biosynthesis protein [Pedobacter sandarakinus]MCX2574296.1 lipopolysaccharide biosynthesis protein [Pedobacter sandarakinus]
MSLVYKARSGIIWSLGQQFSVKFISLFITIILARILTPAEFGLIAMLAIFIAVGNSLMDSGLTSSLIRTRLAGQKDYSTVFFFNLIGSFSVYLLLFLFAPLIATFYKQPSLTNIVRVYGLTFIINAFFSIQSTLLAKELKFKLQTVIQIPAVLVGGCFGVYLANNGYGTWSLVWMNLINSAISTALHWYFSSWRPMLVFSKKSFKRHFHFGYKMTLSGLLDTVYQNLYTIIIGRYYAAAQLGFYSRADSLSQLPIGIISAAINKVAYPMFANIANDDVKLKTLYKKLMQQVLFWNAPILIFLAVVAEPLILLLLTDKWLQAVPYFQILCIAGVLYPVHSYNLNILKVKGKSGQFLKLEIVKKVLSVVGIICVIPFGIMGLLYFQLCFTVFAYYINSSYSGRLINYPLKEQLVDVMPILLLAGILGLGCFYLDYWYLETYHVSNIFRILCIAIIYGGFYLGISNVVKLTAMVDFKQLILKQ